MPEYMYRYHYDDGDYVTSIVAETKDEADARLQRMPLAKYLGEVEFRVPAVPGCGLLIRMACWLRNMIFGSGA